METPGTENEIAIRLIFFVGILVTVALWESMAPRRRLATRNAARRLNNLLIAALNVAVLRLAFPVAAVAFAAMSAEKGWGALNFFDLPPIAAFLIAVVVLDFAIWLQHLMLHFVPPLWRIHRMHHSDLHFDVTTGLRFHPLEILLSMGIKFGAIALLGPPVLAVLAFEIVLNGLAMFNHGNIRMPGRLDRCLRLVIVTPDMHRVHHSVLPRETNSNYGFNLSVWDRLFGTYRAEPEKGHEGMRIGLEHFRDAADHTLIRLLRQPFSREVKQRMRSGSDNVLSP